MTRNTLLPAAKRRRRAFGFTCSILASIFPLMLLQAQQPAAPPASSPPQATPNPAPQNPTPQQAQPPAQPQANQQQGQPDDTDASQPTFVTGANEVNLIFTVTDKHGRYIPN